MSFDRILTSQPVNRLAARQLSRGIEWQPDHKGNPHARTWDIPPPVQKRLPEGGTFKDQTGKQFGRLTVIGYLGKLNAKKKAVWLVRCACGFYETRGSRAIDAADPNAACEKCRYLERVKRGQGNSPFAISAAETPTLPQPSSNGEDRP